MTTDLRGSIVPAADITLTDLDQMYRLMADYYDRVSYDAFLSDFATKMWVIMARCPTSQAIRGFSTQTLLPAPGIPGSQTTKAHVLFSGDTIMHRSHWTRNPLAKLFGQLSLRLIAEHESVDLYWFLISKGYKTYRFLPVFFNEFYPRFDAETPDWATRLIDGLGGHLYPDAYNRAAGIVVADPTSYRLRRFVADLTPARRKDPHVAFFEQRNPGHGSGDELCCLAPLTLANYRPQAYRVIGEPKDIDL